MRLDKNRAPMFPAVVLTICLMQAPTWAMMSIGTGNRPVRDSGWPSGCVQVANLPSRVAYANGPNGGQDHFAYRCRDTAEFNAALETFAAIRVPRLTRPTHAMSGGAADIVDDKPLLVVVHDRRPGSEQQTRWSFFDGQIDWTFTVWVPKYFHQSFSRSPGDFRSQSSYYRQPVPPPRIDVYVGADGPIAWDSVNVPPNVRLIDRRKAAAPVGVTDGGVVSGRLFDMATHQVIAGAEVVMTRQRVKPAAAKPTARAHTDDTGAFTLRGIPEGYYGISAQAEGYAGRSVGAFDNRTGHGFRDFDALLAKTGSLRGQVLDTSGNPVPGIAVSTTGTWGIDGLSYACSPNPTATTDAAGRFELQSLPHGVAALRCRAPGLYQKSINAKLFPVGTEPWEKPVEAAIVVEGMGSVRGTVVGLDGEPPQRPFIVEIEPEGGGGIGTWGGSMTCRKDGSFEFRTMPPGNYVIIAKPNPMREGEATKPKPVTVTVGGVVKVHIVSRHAHGDR